MQPALGNGREKAKDRHKTGINKGVARRKDDSDEDFNMNSSSWDETDSDNAVEYIA